MTHETSSPYKVQAGSGSPWFSKDQGDRYTDTVTEQQAADEKSIPIPHTGTRKYVMIG